MAKELVPDDLWAEIAPLLPPHPPHVKGGHPWCEDRPCLRGVIFVLRSGITWQMLPTEAFGISGSTCWRRFSQWSRAGVWPEVHRRLINRLGRLAQVDLSKAVIDSASVRALFGGHTRVRTP